MKFLAGFIVGVICGIVGSVILLFVIGQFVGDLENQGLTLFSEPGACITKNSLKVFQTLDSNKALVDEKDGPFDSPVMLLVGQEQEHFYDKQVIKIPTKQCAKQIGVYEYRNKDNFRKTVPAVSIQ